MGITSVFNFQPKCYAMGSRIIDHSLKRPEHHRSKNTQREESIFVGSISCYKGSRRKIRKPATVSCYPAVKNLSPALYDVVQCSAFERLTVAVVLPKRGKTEIDQKPNGSAVFSKCAQHYSTCQRSIFFWSRYGKKPLQSLSHSPSTPLSPGQSRCVVQSNIP